MLHLETDIEQLCLDELKEYCIQFEKKLHMTVLII